MVDVDIVIVGRETNPTISCMELLRIDIISVRHDFSFPFRKLSGVG